jgi:hypothetical protein
MIIKKKVLKREINGEFFLVPLGKTVYEANGLFVLTDVGAFLWDLLPGAADTDALVQAVLEEYDVDEATARADIEAFLEKLRSMDIV